MSSQAPTVASVLPAAPPIRKTAMLGEIVIDLGQATPSLAEVTRVTGG